MAQAPPVCVGTSGWSYPGWRSGFYKGIPQRRWLAHCAGHFTGIEVNATFYRFMKPSAFAGWRAQTPDAFAFALKGHRLVTHRSRLKDTGETLENLKDSFAPLGDKLAAVLWQLPPNLEKDADLLRAFAGALAAWPEAPHVLEFRHRSWFDRETAAILEAHGLANCLSDAGRWPLWDAVTAGLVYVRLHGHERTYASEYGDEGLKPWAERIAGWLAEGRRVHVYFDNDAEGAAPYDAMRLMAMLETQPA